MKNIDYKKDNDRGLTTGEKANKIMHNRELPIQNSASEQLHMPAARQLCRLSETHLQNVIWFQLI